MAELSEGIEKADTDEASLSYFSFAYFKKKCRQFSLSLLTMGASLILGLLSFGGMYALWPALIPAFAGFLLSVIYEGEIYSQNLERAFEKLFTQNYFEKQLANDFLKTQQDNDITPDNDLFSFYADYQWALSGNDTKTLDELEETFAQQIRAKSFDDTTKSRHAKELYDYLHAEQPNDEPSLHEQYKTRYGSRKWPLLGIQLFSVVSSLFMGLGTTYLLVEIFTLVPVLAAIPLTIWPLLITPMAAIAGLAYGLLTYNSMTNFMANNTIVFWYKKLRDDLKENPFSLKNIGMAITAVCLFAMALTLTICTAGTWWTIAKEVPPLFQWMKRLPTFIMGVINPIVLGLSSVVFNFENTSETLDMLDNGKGVGFRQYWNNFTNSIKYLWANENPLQWLNPFRLIHRFVIMPMEYVFFVGHLFSIGVTADRIPGLSKYISAAIGSISEGFEDVHYFFGHNHPNSVKAQLDERLGESQGHTHEKNFPLRIIETIALPFVYLARAWDYVFGLLNASKPAGSSVLPTHTTSSETSNADIPSNQNAAHTAANCRASGGLHGLRLFDPSRFARPNPDSSPADPAPLGSPSIV
jgi:hypothetical protein